MKLKIKVGALCRMWLLAILIQVLMTIAECPTWSIFMVLIAIGMTYPEPTFVLEKVEDESK